MSQIPFLNRDHSIDPDAAGRVGYEVWSDMKKLGIDLKFTLSGPLRELPAASRELLAPYRSEILMIYLARELALMAGAWAKARYDVSSKAFKHDEERYYYRLKGRAALVKPTSVTFADLGVADAKWDPSLSGYFGPDGKQAMDHKLWARPCGARGDCRECLKIQGQQSWIELAS